MKKALRILLIVLLIAAIAAAALAWRYRDYLHAYFDTRKYTTEDLQQQMDDNNARLEEILSEYLPPDRANGEVLSEDKQTVGDTQTSQAPTLPETPQVSDSPQTESNDELPTDPEFAAIVSALYQLRDDFSAKLESIKARAYNEYREKNPDNAELATMALKYVREATLLEVECDNKVLALMDRLDKHIKDIGGDPSLSEKILEIYMNEKRVKKAWYFSELEKRGLVL